MAMLAPYISETKLHNPFSICTLSVVFVSSRELVQGLLEWLDNGYLLFPGNRRKFIHYRPSMAGSDSEHFNVIIYNFNSNYINLISSNDLPS